MAFTDLLHQSESQSYGTFSSAAEDNSDAVDTIEQTLADAGWTITGDVKATATVDAPFGMPCGDPKHGYSVDGTNVAIVSVNGEGIRWTTPDYPPLGGWNCITPGETEYESAQILAGALETYGFNVKIVGYFGGYEFQMTSTLAGTNGNGVRVESINLASWYAGSGPSVGGGWILKSSSQADLDKTSKNDTHTKLTVTTASGAFGFGSVHIYVEVEGAEPVDWHTMRGDDWELTANNYSAMFNLPDPEYGAGDEWQGSTFLFCGSLFVPQDITGIIGAGFILTGPHGPNTLGKADAFANANTVVNGKKLIGGGFGQHGFSFAYFHYQKGSRGANYLQTRENKSVMVPALVIMPTMPLDGGPDESRVVGYLWDAFIDTSYQAPGTEVDIEETGQSFKSRMAQADGAIGTLFTIETEAEGGAEPAPQPVAAPPAGAPPSQRTWSGVVNATFFEIDWVTGNLFDPAMEGMTIQLGSPAVPYTVSSVGPDQKVLSITTAYVNPAGGNSATNIPYSV